MKNQIILLLSLVFTCCDKPRDIDQPNPPGDDPSGFKIEIINKTVKLEEPVNFKFEGTTNYLYFYSGEEGHRYEYKERNYIEDGKGEFSFCSVTTATTVDNRTMKAYISSDFNGDYTTTSIEKANWKELTDLFAWPNKEKTGEVFSELVDVSEYAGKDTVFVAFKYVGQAGVYQPAWILRKIKLEYKTEEQIYPIFSTMDEASFKFAYYEEPPQRKWETNIPQQIRITSASDKPPYFSTWAVSKAFSLNKVSPDVGVEIINLVDKAKEFQYTYTKPGEYKVVFEYRDVSVTPNVVETREFKIKVTE